MIGGRDIEAHGTARRVEDRVEVEKMKSRDHGDHLGYDG